MKLVLSACALALVAASSAAGSSVPLRRRRACTHSSTSPTRASAPTTPIPRCPPSPGLPHAARASTSCSSRRAGASTRRHSSRPRDDRSRRVDSGSGAVDDRQPVRALGPRSRALRHADIAVEHTVWLQHALALVPERRSSADGLIRWSPVDGATGYEVLYLGVPGGFNVHFSTITNVADEREWWSFHEGMAASVKWRVRAVRVVKSPRCRTVCRSRSTARTRRSTPPATSGSYTGAPIAGISATSDVDSTARRAPASADARLRLEGDGLQVGRHARRALARLCLQRQAVRQPRHGRLGHRQPRVGAARHRAAQDARHVKDLSTRQRKYLGMGAQDLSTARTARCSPAAELGGAAASAAAVGGSSGRRAQARPRRPQQQMLRSRRSRTTAGPRGATGGRSFPCRPRSSRPIRKGHPGQRQGRVPRRCRWRRTSAPPARCGRSGSRARR